MLMKAKTLNSIILLMAQREKNTTLVLLFVGLKTVLRRSVRSSSSSVVSFLQRDSGHLSGPRCLLVSFNILHAFCPPVQQGASFYHSIRLPARLPSIYPSITAVERNEVDLGDE